MPATSPPRSAAFCVDNADCCARCAFSAFLRTVAEISSIEAEVSSRLAACSSVRCDRSVVAIAISLEALVTSRAELLICVTVSRTWAIIAFTAVTICATSSLLWMAGSETLKSPSAT